MVKLSRESFKALPSDERELAMFDEIVDISQRLGVIEDARKERKGLQAIFMIFAGVVGSVVTIVATYMSKGN